MKQLLNISKERKSSIKPNLKQIFADEPSDQEEDFIYDDRNYNESDGPTDTEIRTYAQILGIKLPEEEDLLYIARQCLNEPLPQSWYCDEDQRGEIIYVNKESGEISFQHPCDEIFRAKVITERKKKIKTMKKQLPKVSVGKSKTNFIQNVFNMKEDGQFELQKSRPEKEQRASQLGKILSSKQIIDKNEFEMEEEKQAISKRQKKKSVAPIQLSFLKEEQKETKIPNNKKAKIEVRPQFFEKKANPEVIEAKKKQIQEKLSKKYEALTAELDFKFIESIRQMRKRQNDLQNMEAELVDKSLETLDKRKKEIEMKVMLEHSARIQKKRIEADKQHRLDLVQISSKYQIDDLFTEMASCRSFISRPRGQREKASYLEEIEKNAKIINKIEIEKSVAQMQKECNKKMYSLLSEVVNSKKGDHINIEQIYKVYTNRFEEFIEKSSWVGEKGKVLEENRMLKQAQEQQVKNESFSIFHELEQLKLRLKQLQEDDGTHRSNLSDKQNKLYELLHNRVGNLTSRSSNYH